MLHFVPCQRESMPVTDALLPRASGAGTCRYRPIKFAHTYSRCSLTFTTRGTWLNSGLMCSGLISGGKK